MKIYLFLILNLISGIVLAADVQRMKGFVHHKSNRYYLSVENSSGFKENYKLEANSEQLKKLNGIFVEATGESKSCGRENCFWAIDLVPVVYDPLSTRKFNRSLKRVQR